MNLKVSIFDNPIQYHNHLDLIESESFKNERNHNIYFYIDILRATSTILTMLDNDVNDIKIFKTKELAFEEYSSCSPIESKFLCGEENSIKPNGFFAGNSPLEYLSNPKLLNSKILFTSTNGAKIIANNKNQGYYFEFLENSNTQRYILSFLNFSTMINLVKYHYFEKTKNYEYYNINLVCGGENNNISIEDSVCAIYFSKILIQNLSQEIKILQSKESEAILNILEKSNLINKSKKLDYKIFKYIQENSTHIKRLNELNCGEDIDFCLQFDKINLIAKVVGNKIFKI